VLMPSGSQRQGARARVDCVRVVGFGRAPSWPHGHKWLGTCPCHHPLAVRLLPKIMPVLGLVCEPECPVDAIKPDMEPGLDFWLDLNRKYSEVWPNITRKKPAPPDADAFVNVPDKFAKYFSPNPGEGD
jgi:hypothetical protein